MDVHAGGERKHAADGGVPVGPERACLKLLRDRTQFLQKLRA